MVIVVIRCIYYILLIHVVLFNNTARFHNILKITWFFSFLHHTLTRFTFFNDYIKLTETFRRLWNCFPHS